MLVVGMSAYFCAITNAPVCSILIACEVTGNYHLLLPAMWTCALTFLISREWSIYPAQFPSIQGVGKLIQNERNNEDRR